MTFINKENIKNFRMYLYYSISNKILPNSYSF